MHTVYVSDTTAGSANQTWFVNDREEQLSRVYYRLTNGGTSYILTYSDVIDGTFADGSKSVCNDRCGGFEIVSLRVGVCSHSDMVQAVEPRCWQTVTFGGTRSRVVASGETVQTDPIAVTVRGGETLCVELCAKGCRLPCHEELQIAAFVKDGDEWRPSTHLPVPLTVAVAGDPLPVVGFFGDSITQGIGATPNAYRHVAARLGERLKGKAACHNLGIGFGRASDAASGGAWFARAAKTDVVVLCFGVNDLIRGRAAEEIAADLGTVIARLQQGGTKVVLQAVPPFEFAPPAKAEWERLNALIRKTLSRCADAFLDTVFLCDACGDPRYGGHPNDAGCAVWAEKLLLPLEALLTRI
ncbi:MAG: SGNH/GDSL hydrolase family protein [Clostridia bacterium]|nr:SGNH/GDSL hydrolase family protein [Clostridia bacterium]